MPRQEPGPSRGRLEAAGATRSAFPPRWATTHAEAPRCATRPGRPRPGPSLTQSSVPQLMVQGPGRGPGPSSPAIAEALRNLRMRKARRPPPPPARASSGPGSPPPVAPRGAKWPEEAAAATAAARPPRTGAEGRGGAGRGAGRGGAGLTAPASRPAPRLPLTRSPGGLEGSEPLGTPPRSRRSAAGAPHALETRAHCLQPGPPVITTLRRGLPSIYRARRGFAFQNFRPGATDAHLRRSGSGCSLFGHRRGPRSPAARVGVGPGTVTSVHCVHREVEENSNRADPGSQGRNSEMYAPYPQIIICALFYLLSQESRR